MTEKAKHYTQFLAVRVISISMGFVYFSAGWRRFYNTPAKHDIESAAHLANKLVGAAPGSPIESVIHWVLYNPGWAEIFTYLFSTGELLAGAGLILGAFTRLAAIGSALMHIALMLIFGWMGYECLDEWTMAALGFAISVTIMFIGSGSYSVDSYLKKDWFAGWFTPSVKITLTIASVLMTVGFYTYFFDFFGPFKKRTSTHNYRVVAEQVVGDNNKTTLYVNAGGSATATYVKSITFDLSDGSQVVQNANEIVVTREHFAPWSKSGKVVDGVLKLRLGSKVDIEVPENAVSATLDLIDAKDQKLDLTYGKAPKVENKAQAPVQEPADANDKE